MASGTRLTIEDFEKLPQAAVENRELVDGELVDVSGNTLDHNRLRDLFVQVLGSFVEERKPGEIIAEQEFDFDGNAHGPDVSFVRAEKVPFARSEAAGSAFRSGSGHRNRFSKRPV